MRGEEGDCVKLLEGAAGDKVSFRGPGKEKKWEGIGVRVANLLTLCISDVSKECTSYGSKARRRMFFDQSLPLIVSVYNMDKTYTCHCVEDARSSYHEAYSWLTGQVAIRTRSIAGGLLVPKANEPYAEVDSFLCDLHHGYPYDAEQDSDTEVSQGACDDMSTGRMCHRD